jgi:multidrug efflux pump
MNFSAIFIKRPVAATLFAVAVTLAGLAAFRVLPIASLPQVDFATITVTAALPGASPQIMASSVATPLERQFGRIAGVTQMTSNSSLGLTTITLQFDLTRDIDGAARDVEAAINASRTYLPANLPSNPAYRKINSAVAPILVLSLTSETRDAGTLFDTASSVIQQKISPLEGVGQVLVAGSSLPAVHVDVNPEQLNNYGLGMQDVARVISLQNSNRPKGQFSNDQLTIDITADDQISKAKEYAPLVVSTANQAVVRLQDVAHVYDSVQTVRSVAYSNGQPSVILLVFRLPGANVIETVDRIKAALPSIRASIPAGDNLEVLNDTTTTIRASVTDVEQTLVFATILVIAVVFVFLRSPRSTLIPGVAVTVSLIGTFGVMYLCGYSLNNLSLMALTISTGFVVDDAIVVMENIARHIEAGVRPFEATFVGSREVAFTVVSMSFSLIAVFVPILFMGGIVGRLFHEFAATLVAAIAISMVISLTVTPTMCAYVLTPTHDQKHGRLYWTSEKAFDAMLRGYRNSLAWTLEHPAFVFVLFLATFALNGALLVRVPKGFFPLQDTGTIMGGFQGSQDASFQSMRASLIEIEKVIQLDPAVAVVAGFTGGQGGPGGGSINSGFLFVILKPLAERKISAGDILNRLRPKLNALPGASTYLQPAQDLTVGGRQSNAAYQYQISSDTVEDLSTWGPKLYEQMRHMPSLRDVTTDQQDRGLQMLLEYDRSTAARLGITTQMINNSLYYEFGESQVSTIYTPMNQYYVILSAAPQFLDSPAWLNSTFVHSTGSGSVPLAVISHGQASTSPLAVNHSSFFPSVTIAFNLGPGVSLGQATTEIQRLQQRIGMPSSIRGQFAGTAEAYQKSLSTEPFLILGALLAIYIVLGILYESLIHPITILTTLPSASVGAFLSLILFHSEFDVISFIGIILLVGIVKKNAIMMIDFALQAEREEGKNTRDAIFEASLLRFRPILMTTFAAILGALPLAFGRGTGSELRHPLGIAVVGGLVFSQIMTLYSTPVIYLYFDRIAHKFKRDTSNVQLTQEPANAPA